LDPRRIDVMRSMGTRRVALVAGAASVAAVALAGCSAGQVAETANKNPSVYGVNVENSDRSVSLRGIAVSYVSPKGYPAGASAPLELSVFNETRAPITIRIGSQPLAGADASQGVVAAKAVAMSGSATSSGGPDEVEPIGSRNAARDIAPTASDAPGISSLAPSSNVSIGPTTSVGPESPDEAEPAGTPSPTPAATRPAEITIPPLESAIFRPGDSQSLQLVGLTGPLVPGNSVNLVFTFSNGAEPLVVQAPVAVPLSPAPRGSGEHEGVGEGEHG
jgi:hypothetical protein